MVVCKFFQQGNCRNGNNCSFEHVNPGGGRGRGGFGGNQGPNRGGFGGGSNFNPGRGGFGGFNNNPNRGNFQGGRGALQHGSHAVGNQRNTDKLFIDPKIIEADLTTDRPLWPLSCYSPRIETARQLLEGEIEISPEEMRYRSYLLASQGQTGQIAELEASTFGAVQEKVRSILNNLKAAAKYAATGQDQHPNRHDMLNPAVAQPNTGEASQFGQPSAQQGAGAANPFDAPSAPRPNPFAQPSVLGQPSPFAQATNQPHAAGFGQPSALGGASLFAKAGIQAPGAQLSLFDQVAQNKPNPQAFNPFAQPQQPQQPQQAYPFGQPSQSAANAFAQNAAVNGQSQPPQASANPFANNQAAYNPFANPPQPSNAQPGPFGPNGVPTVPPVDDPPTEMYAGNEAVYQSAYQHARQNGAFEASLMPMLPPRVDWISYDNI